MPQAEQRKPTGFEPYAFPTNHKEVQATGGKACPLRGTAMYCRRCYEHAQRDGPMGWYCNADGRRPGGAVFIV